MFLSRKKTHVAGITFSDSFSLSNVRVINFTMTNTEKEPVLNFMPYRPANNPYAFKDLQAFNVNVPQVFAQDFPVKNPIVFFFSANDYATFRAFNFFNYLRNNYSDCKVVCRVANPVYYYQNAQKIFIDKASTDEFMSTFDCVLTYNQIDAIDYGLTYYEGPYSVLPFEQPKQDVDIFYVGAAKNRLEKILRAYQSFKEAGFICDFYINSVPVIPKIKSDDLHFNKPLSYLEVLDHVLRSKAILDIAQQGTYGLTVRYFESLAYDKNFITNNTFYRQDRFASPKLFLIDKSYNIDKRQFMNAAELSNNYKNEYSPLHLISFLEYVLNSQ